MTGRPAESDRSQPGAAVRYRCTLCGNLTRFDVIERKRTRSYYHYTLGGLLSVDEEEILESQVDEVRCRWCNAAGSVEEVPALEDAPGRTAGEN